MDKRKIHPEVWVNLRDKTDRFVVVGKVVHALKQAAVPPSEVEDFREEAHKAKTTEELFGVVEHWVRVTRE